MAQNADQVRTGPGTLYIAPVGSTEPVHLSSAWPGAWTDLGYTDEGSQFTFGTETEDVEVAEEFYPIRKVVTGKNTTIEFALAQTTATNLSIANNGGTITTASGYTTFEPPEPGDEVRKALGWESEDGDERFIFRQCFQSGDTSIAHRKGADKATIPVSFEVEKPAGSSPWKSWHIDE